MKKLMLLAAAAAIMVSCGTKQEEGMRVKVNATNYPEDIMTISWYDREAEKMVADTIHLTDGKGEVLVNYPEDATIALNNLDLSKSISTEWGTIPGPALELAMENGVVEVTFDNNTWPVAEISGGKGNNDLNAYNKGAAPIIAQQYKFYKYYHTGEGEEVKQEDVPDLEEYNKQFVNNNPDNRKSANVLANMMLFMPTEEVIASYDKFSDDVKNSVSGKKLFESIEKAKAMMPGQPAPQFTKTDKDGNTVNLSDYMGKYVLIDFWGSWCGPCRSSHPHLVKLYEQYSPKGVVFINVAQEGGKDARTKWLEAVEKDGLVWTQILNDEGKEQCDVVELYGIGAFPTKVLIDQEGKLVKTWIGDSEDVDVTLASLF